MASRAARRRRQRWHGTGADEVLPDRALVQPDILKHHAKPPAQPVLGHLPIALFCYPDWREGPGEKVREAEKGMDRYLEATPLLDFYDRRIQGLLARRGWRTLSTPMCMRAIYDFVRDEILFGYNEDDNIPASQVLLEGYGQCNTKATLCMALFRACGIPCRIHGFTIDKRLQKGVMMGLVYRKAPAHVLHSWVEACLDGCWYQLEGLILDSAYLQKLQARFSGHGGPFCGFGVATADLQHPQVDFDLCDTYIQRDGIDQDFGLYDSPDDLYAHHRQAMSPLKRCAYQHLGRRQMNRKVRQIREG